ncbi:hypothetical protein ACFWTE_07065 [Nocardiopsis sp. NPDC058631]|uniref:hypothetical protein n=1 Tax=Nocardiopsis sp. NPDC058631 TaxID=3346566 RepID=UPI00365AFA03
MTAEERPTTLLLLLQRQFAREWTIRRNGGLWVATTREHECTHAPTLIEEDVEAFVHQLVHPPSAIGNSGRPQEQVSETGFRAKVPQDGPLEG